MQKCSTKVPSILFHGEIFWQKQQNSDFALFSIHRKKFTTGLIELAAVMATDKVYRKAAKASKAF
jgi:hypothetical protein